MSHRTQDDPVQRLNDHHADDLLAVARAFGGHPGATAARAERVGPDGLDLVLETPAGRTTVHVDFTTSVGEQRGALPKAFRDLTHQAQAVLTEADDESTNS